MTAAQPLPLPSEPTLEHAPVDIGGARLRYAAAASVAEQVRPVVERYRQYRESGEPLDGLRTIVGFTLWQLHEDESGTFTLHAPDYQRQDLDLVDHQTSDLSTALWVEAAQSMAAGSTGTVRDEVIYADTLSCTRAALKVLESRTDDELVLTRERPDGDGDSGWRVATAAKAGLLGRREAAVHAGLLVRDAPVLVSLLQLPVGTTARVAGQRVVQLVPGSGSVPGDGTDGAADDGAPADIPEPEPAQPLSPADLVLAQQEVVQRAGVGPEPIAPETTVAIQQVVIDSFVRREPIVVVMERNPLPEDRRHLDDGTLRSGWNVWAPLPELTDEQARTLNVDAAEIAEHLPALAPYLALPTGTMLQLLGERLAAAHLVDHERLEAALETGAHQTMGEVLSDPEIARPILTPDA